MIISKYLPFLLCVILISACQTISKKKLYGTWLAVELIEEGEIQDIDLSSASFTFNDDMTYYYDNTEFLREAGKYELRGSVVITNDTLNQMSEQKAVEIIYLDKDSLHFEMNAAGKRQVLKLVKDNPVSDDSAKPEEYTPADTEEPESNEEEL
ncbi:MAG: lipocalin family protein [Saprospiraceae bacterium]|nr:lipocalin family protein [Saprospiraceae bacterium]